MKSPPLDPRRVKERLLALSGQPESEDGLPALATEAHRMALGVYVVLHALRMWAPHPTAIESLAEGGVSFEWHEGDRGVSLAVWGDGSMSVVRTEGFQSSDSEPFPFSYRKLSALLRWVIEPGVDPPFKGSDTPFVPP